MAQDKKVKLKFNFDTLIGGYKKTMATLIGGREIEVEDFNANEYVKQGEVKEVDESIAKQLINDLIKVPVGIGGKTTQRIAVDDFEPDRYIPRAELVA